MQRYENYKPSGIQWVSQIPGHWEVERAKWLFKRMERPVRQEDGVVTAFRDGQVTLRTNRRTEGFSETESRGTTTTLITVSPSPITPKSNRPDRYYDRLDRYSTKIVR